MAPKRARTGKASFSRAQHGTPHGSRQPPTRDLQFTDIAHRNRYEGLRSRTITNTRYIDNEVLDVLGISDDGLEEAKGRNWIDLATCQAMKIITRMGDHYHLLLPDSLSSLSLPDPTHLTIQIREKWWLQAPSDDAEHNDHPAPPPPTPSHAAGSSRGPRPDASTTDTLQRILDQQQ
ncbi:hypothetical protein Salat_1846700 [Sesamum alatum]|uniref:Uncharacterized protein n=1 Tax=Sesamum alatum TaxID=300844 RepID=A0AAE2CHU1_9LAMI|nr:hypothetical protein Salat_1846700 [Sesamum alatum]